MKRRPQGLRKRHFLRFSDDQEDDSGLPSHLLTTHPTPSLTPPYREILLYNTSEGLSLEMEFL